MKPQAVSPRAHAARPARAAVPALPPLDALDRTHHQLVVVLSEMQQLVESLAAAGPEPALRRM